MSDSDTKKNKSGKDGWLGFFAKLLFFVLVFLIVILMVLSSLGGNSETLKGAIEQFIGSKFGGTATIEKLNQMTFYPYMGADFEGLNVYRGDESNSIMTADKVSVAMGFWDVTFGKPDLKAFNIKNLKADPGALMAQGFSAEQIAIVDEGDKVNFRADGKIGGTPIRITAPMEKKGVGKNKQYSFSDIRPLEAVIGNVNASGKFERQDIETMRISELSLGFDQPVFTGELEFYQGGEGRLKIKGDLKYGQGSMLKPDILIEQDKEVPHISGEVDFTDLILDDALNYEPAFDLFDALADVVESDKAKKEDGPGYDLQGVSIDGRISIQKLTKNGIQIGKLSFPLKLANGDLHAGPIEGRFNGSETSGDIMFKSSVKPAELTQKITIKNYDYGPIQQALNDAVNVKGSADILVDLKTSGNNGDELKANMGGNFSIVSGHGEFPAKVLSFWGQGLLNVMLPDLNPQEQTVMNCAVVDFDLEKGIAKSNALFIDTDQLTIKGEGKYNYFKDDLDLKIKPETKSVTIAGTGIPVVVSGPLSDPSYAPSLMGLGETIGKLALGAINPAFLLVTMTDLGLSDNHPCKKFIEGEAKE